MHLFQFSYKNKVCFIETVKDLANNSNEIVGFQLYVHIYKGSHIYKHIISQKQDPFEFSAQ